MIDFRKKRLEVLEEMDEVKEKWDHASVAYKRYADRKECDPEKLKKLKERVDFFAKAHHNKFLEQVSYYSRRYYEQERKELKDAKKAVESDCDEQEDE
mgnify:CR=1 FL=1